MPPGRSEENKGTRNFSGSDTNAITHQPITIECRRFNSGHLTLLTYPFTQVHCDETGPGANIETLSAPFHVQSMEQLFSNVLPYAMLKA